MTHWPQAFNLEKFVSMCFKDLTTPSGETDTNITVMMKANLLNLHSWCSTSFHAWCIIPGSDDVFLFTEHRYPRNGSTCFKHVSQPQPWAYCWLQCYCASRSVYFMSVQTQGNSCCFPSVLPGDKTRPKYPNALDRVSSKNTYVSTC